MKTVSAKLSTTKKRNDVSTRVPAATLILNRDIAFKDRRIKGVRYTIDRELARGGEGTIHTLCEEPTLVAKLFHSPSIEKAEKLKAMLARIPHDPDRAEQGHISIAWPVASIFNDQGECLGFLMPYIDQKDSMPLLHLYNPGARKATGRNFNWSYLLRMVENLTRIIRELHRTGYVVGDLNESNILVDKHAMVTLVDCDSIQVPKPRTNWQDFFQQREYFPCVVGKPEYTPPELQGRDFRRVHRTPNHDTFALAVLIFLMLMEGWHPFFAIWNSESEAPSIEQRIRRGIFPYVGRYKKLRPTYAPPLAILPQELQDLMIECFLYRHKPGPLQAFFRKRPSAAVWLSALQRAEGHLTTCQVNTSHIYNRALSACPWCERVARNIPDSFPRAQAQKGVYTLPTGQQKPTKTRRRRRNVLKQSGQQYTVASFCTIFLYLCELYVWHAYRPWVQHSAPAIQGMILLLLLAFPLIIFLMILTRNRE